MRQYLSGHDLFAELLMTRTTFAGAILILEGTTDCRVFEEFRHATCRAIPAAGRDIAIEAISLADAQNMNGILAIVDADFARLGCFPPPNSPNIVMTDAHDIELIVLGTPAFDRLVREYCHDAKLRTFLAIRSHSTLASALLESAADIGIIRLLALRSGERLRFRNLVFAPHVDGTSLRFNLGTLLPAILSNSPNATRDAKWIVAETAVIASGKPDPNQLCSGHDVAHILSVGLQGTLGDCDPSVADRRNIERMFRIAFGRAELEGTLMYQAIRSWEQANPPYRILN
jgi:hypothetical protein